MMGGLRVAQRTCPSCVASFGRATRLPADSTLHRAMMRGQLHPRRAPGIDGAGSIRHRSQACTEDTSVNLLTRRAAPEESQSGFLGRGGQAERGGVAVKVFKVDFPGQRTRVWRSSSFSPRTASGFNSSLWSRTTRRPASCSCAAWRGSGGAVLRREEALTLSPLETWTLFRLCQTLALVFIRQSMNAFGRISCVFHVKVALDLEVVWPSELGNLDTSFTSPLYLTVAPLRQSTEVFKNCTIFYVHELGS